MTQHINPQTIQVQWHKIGSYEEAKDFHLAVYIHDWDNMPYYIGMLGESVFGGNRRVISDSIKYPDISNPRYGSSYSHWIDGCLEHGANLYIGTFPVTAEALAADDDKLKENLPILIEIVEKLLQIQLRPVKGNLPSAAPPNLLSLEHTGDVPPYLK